MCLFGMGVRVQKSDFDLMGRQNDEEGSNVFRPTP